MSSPLGIIAGAGRYPLALIREARRSGQGVAVVALERVAVAAIEQESCPCRRLAVGQLEAAASFLRGCGASAAVLAGGVPWRPLEVRPRPDRHALAALCRAARARAGDDRLLREVARAFEALGVEVVGPGPMAAHLLAGPGAIGGPPLPARLAPLVERAIGAARALGARDRGQAAVASEAGVALEGRGGTDRLLRRTRGGVLVKVAKPGQDRRFDLPAVGPATIAAAARAGLEAVVVEAGATLVLDRAEAAALADRFGVSLLAVSL